MAEKRNAADSSEPQPRHKRARRHDQSTSPERSPSPGPSKAKSSSEVKKERWQQKYGHLDPQEALEKQSDLWYDKTRKNASQAYHHFHKPYLEGNKYVFVCKKNLSEKMSRAPYEDSTGNFSAHIAKCDPKKKGNIAAYASGSTYSTARFRYLTAIWIARRKRPFTIIEDPELIEIFQMLYGRVDIHSERTVSRDIQDIYNLTKSFVAQILQNYTGKLHFAIDGWASPNFLSVLGISCIRYFEGKVEEFTLDFINKRHTGRYLAVKFFEALKAFGILHMILAVAGDNAENNSTMVDHLSTLISNFEGQDSRVRCFAHILNLVVKAILSVFMLKRKRNAVVADADVGNEESGDESEDEEEDEEVDPDREAWDEERIEEVEEELTDSELYVLARPHISTGVSAMKKCDKLCRKSAHSGDFRADLKTSAEEHNLDSTRMLVKPVSTRWNTKAESTSSCINLKEPIIDICDRVAWNQGKQHQRLRRLIPNDEEWAILEELEPLLELFLLRTLEFSKSGVALIHQVIPAMDKLTDAMCKVRDDRNLNPAVRYAASKGVTMMNKYYSKTDQSAVYRIAMIMSPMHKTSYFRKQDWQEEWIEEAIRLAREVWQKRYRPTRPVQPSSSTSKKAKKQNYLEREFFAPEAQQDDFEEYICSAPLANMSNPFTYWESMKDRCPELAQMGFDYCSVPATSVHTERSFSGGSHMISRFCHSLSDQSVSAGVVLSSWLDHKFVPAEKAIEMFRSRSTRSRAEAESSSKQSSNTVDSTKTDVIAVNSSSDSE